MSDTAEQPLNRAQRRAQGRYASAGHGGKHRQTCRHYGEALRAEIRQH